MGLIQEKYHLNPTHDSLEIAMKKTKGQMRDIRREIKKYPDNEKYKKYLYKRLNKLGERLEIDKQLKNCDKCHVEVTDPKKLTFVMTGIGGSKEWFVCFECLCGGLLPE